MKQKDLFPTKHSRKRTTKAQKIISTGRVVRCKYCGRVLTDEESIRVGIGPECRTKRKPLKTAGKLF